jgi:hypothetical protein
MECVIDAEHPVVFESRQVRARKEHHCWLDPAQVLPEPGAEVLICLRSPSPVQLAVYEGLDPAGEPCWILDAGCVRGRVLGWQRCPTPLPKAII